MNISLTKEQQSTLTQLNFFLAAPGSGVFILKGYAGTGKTYLLQQLAGKLKKDKKKFVLLAPTGRAAAVLRSKTDLEAKTIHSEIYQFSDVDGEADENMKDPTINDFGQMRLLFGLRGHDTEEKKIYIIDEASMVSDEPGDPTSYAHFGSGHLLSDLLLTAGTNKIIFAGDPAQLPPITQSNSPALEEKWMRSQGKIVQSAELNTILRQKADSGILKLATKVRNLTERSVSEKWVKLPARGISNISLMGYQELKQKYLQDFEAGGIETNIAICHSNAKCIEISKSIRQKRYGNPMAGLQNGDILMVTQNNYIVPLVNGDFVEVVFIGQPVRHAGIGFLHVRVKAVHNKLEYEILLCNDILFSGAPNLSNDQQRLLMIDFSKRMRANGVKPKSQRYYAALETDPYMNSLRANFGYAVTCHKSQGGEWDNVYLFLHKSMYIMNQLSLTRWWYTAITRAKEKLFIVDDWWIK